MTTPSGSISPKTGGSIAVKIDTKDDCRLRRCHLKGALGDALHAVLCAAGYNLRWLLRWIAAFLASIVVRLLGLQHSPLSIPA